MDTRKHTTFTLVEINYCHSLFYFKYGPNEFDLIPYKNNCSNTQLLSWSTEVITSKKDLGANLFTGSLTDYADCLCSANGAERITAIQKKWF